MVGLRGSYDAAQGGFARAPKFPMASVIEFLLARGETEMSLGTLRAMARGGIYDQVGGGFARYAVDATWTVPHFEKMLYDNALLARAYLHGWQVSGDPLLRRVCTETLDWALREMRGPEGGFCAALDADSEGVEGKFYVWTAAELRAALDELAEPALAYFGATEAGNFEGANVLEARGPEPEQREEIRAAALHPARRARVARARRQAAVRMERADDHCPGRGGRRPERARVRRGGVGRGRVRARLAARREGQLLRTWKDGRAQIDGYLEDYAFTVQALTALYEATFEPRWYQDAIVLADAMIARFADPERGGFFTTAADRPLSFARRKDLEDSPIPSGSSAAAFGLLRLARLTGQPSTSATRLGGWRCWPRSPGVTRSPSATHSRPSTFTWRACGRWRLPARGRRPTRWPMWSARASRRTWCSRADRPSRCRCWRPRAARGQPGRLRLRALRLPGAGQRSASPRRGAVRPGGARRLASEPSSGTLSMVRCERAQALNRLTTASVGCCAHPRSEHGEAPVDARAAVAASPRLPHRAVT